MRTASPWEPSPPEANDVEETAEYDSFSDSTEEAPLLLPAYIEEDSSESSLSDDPSDEPLDGPTDEPLDGPTEDPTDQPTEDPTDQPTEDPTDQPTEDPTDQPTEDPTDQPTDEPTYCPDLPTVEPTEDPTEDPTADPDMPNVWFEASPHNRVLWEETPQQKAYIRVRRDGDIASSLRVHFTSDTGVAEPDLDFRSENSVTIPAGRDFLDVPITVKRDQIPEEVEIAEFELIDSSDDSYTVTAAARYTRVQIHEVGDNPGDPGTPGFDPGNDPEDDPSDEPSTPTVSFEYHPDYLTRESVNQDPAYVYVKRSGDISQSLTVYFADNRGSATPGEDFNSVTSVFFPAGVDSRTLDITALNDSIPEPTQYAGFELLDHATYDLGSTTEASITIHDNEGWTATIQATDAAAFEANENHAFFRIRLTGGQVQGADVIVQFEITGTASYGDDWSYIASADGYDTHTWTEGATRYGSVRIPYYVNQALLSLRPEDDAEENEPVENVTLTLVPTGAVVGGYYVGSPGSATASIYDNDDTDNTPPFLDGDGLPDVTVGEGAPDRIFQLDNYFSDADDPDEELRYEIIANTNPGLFDQISINDITRELELDFSPTDAGVASVTVRVYDTAGGHKDDEFRVRIAPPVTVTRDRSQLLEAGGSTATFTFTRQGDLSEALDLEFSFTGTAILGQDFVVESPASGNIVRFLADEPTATLTVKVPLLRDVGDLDSTNETIKVQVAGTSSFAETTIVGITLGQLFEDVKAYINRWEFYSQITKTDSKANMVEALEDNLNPFYEGWVVPIRDMSAQAASVVGAFNEAPTKAKLVAVVIGAVTNVATSNIAAGREATLADVEGQLDTEHDARRDWIAAEADRKRTAAGDAMLVGFDELETFFFALRSTMSDQPVAAPTTNEIFGDLLVRLASHNNWNLTYSINTGWSSTDAVTSWGNATADKLNSIGYRPD